MPERYTPTKLKLLKSYFITSVSEQVTTSYHQLF